MKIQLNQLGRPSGDVLCTLKCYVVHFCKHCGTELYGEWAPCQKGVSGMSLRKEFQKIINMDKCVFCGATLSKDFGESIVLDPSMLLVGDIDHVVKLIESYDLDTFRLSIDYICTAMQMIRHKQQTEEAGKIADALLAQYESAETSTVIPGYESIKNDSEKLKGYLLNLIQVETNIFSLVSRLKKLYAQRIDIDRGAYFSTLKPTIEANGRVEARQRYLTQCEKALKEIQAKDPEPIDLPKPKQPTKPTEPQYAQPGFFNKKRVLAENAELKAKYDQALDRYESRLDRYYQELENWKQQFEAIRKQHEDQHQQDIEKARQKVTAAKEKLAEAKNAVAEATKNSSNIASPEKAHKAILDDEIRQAEDMLQKAIRCKHQLYNYNIVFAKYRNIVAISTIYEYLMAGRCTELEGTNGAYNLYESELRANIIISQLSSVLESLEKIKDSQFMIYDAIQQTNASLYRLESTMSAAAKSLSSIDAKAHTMTNYMAKIANNSDVIAHNTAVTAHYSKINAELTNALGYMVALR